MDEMTDPSSKSMDMNIDLASTHLRENIQLPIGETASVRIGAGSDTLFSPIDLRDRVVIMLLFDQVVREDHVELAWQLWHQMEQGGVREPLWRVLTLFPDLDRELVYAEAARVYGFEEARISRSHALALIKSLERRLRTGGFWGQLVELRVVPISETETAHSHRPRVVFATPDPTRPEVHRLMPQLPLPGFELRYASESDVVALLVEAFPNRYAHLKEMSGLTRDLLEGTMLAELDALDVLQPADVSSPEPSLAKADMAPPASAWQVFEDVLEEAVQERVRDICLLPNDADQIEVYFQVGDDLVRQRVVDHFSASSLVAAVKREVLHAAPSEPGAIRKGHIERWVNGALVRFRVSAIPPSEEVPAECIVVHVVQ